MDNRQDTRIEDMPGLLQMVQKLIPGYSGKAVDDRIAQQLQQAGASQGQPAEAENPQEDAQEGYREEGQQQQMQGQQGLLEQLLQKIMSQR